MSSATTIKRARKVLRIVAELHLRGYQRLRISPHWAPSGMHWRCIMTPASNILVEHGAKVADWDQPLARYSSGQENKYFEWTDAAGKTPSELADMFVKRFPRVVELGQGRDWSYAGWFVEMLHLTYPTHVPVLPDDSDKAMVEWMMNYHNDGSEPKKRLAPEPDTDPASHSRVLRATSPESDKVIFVPLPPPGEAPTRKA